MDGIPHIISAEEMVIKEFIDEVEEAYQAWMRRHFSHCSNNRVAGGVSPLHFATDPALYRVSVLV